MFPVNISVSIMVFLLTGKSVQALVQQPQLLSLMEHNICLNSNLHYSDDSDCINRCISVVLRKVSAVQVIKNPHSITKEVQITQEPL